MIFIGYEPGSKAYRVYGPTTRRVHVSRDVVFDEAACWDWDKDVTAAERSEELVVEYTMSSVPVAATHVPRRASPTPSGTEYMSVVGGLRYLVHTRPDICFAVGYLSRFM
jgi:hypothetical protein